MSEFTDIQNDLAQVHFELDRLGAPKTQPSGFGYSPVGRLRALTSKLVGQYYAATLAKLTAENERLRTQLAGRTYFHSDQAVEDTLSNLMTKYDALAKENVALREALKAEKDAIEGVAIALGMDKDRWTERINKALFNALYEDIK